MAALELRGYDASAAQRLPRVTAQVEHLLRASGVVDRDDLQDRLEDQPYLARSIDQLVRRSSTRFLRDHDTFRRIAFHVLPELSLRAHQEGRDSVDAWCAGCGSGEEVYSLVLMAWLSSRGKRPDPPLNVLGTDVDESAIERAREAQYSQRQARTLPTDLHERTFVADGAGVRVRDELRETARFEVQDLRSQSPTGHFDLVLLRNLPYADLSPSMQARLLARLHATTRPGSWIVVGSHESLPAEGWLVEATPGFYRRPD